MYWYFLMCIMDPAREGWMMSSTMRAVLAVATLVFGISSCEAAVLSGHGLIVVEPRGTGCATTETRTSAIQNWKQSMRRRSRAGHRSYALGQSDGTVVRHAPQCDGSNGVVTSLISTARALNDDSYMSVDRLGRLVITPLWASAKSRVNQLEKSASRMISDAWDAVSSARGAEDSSLQQDQEKQQQQPLPQRQQQLPQLYLRRPFGWLPRLRTHTRESTVIGSGGQQQQQKEEGKEQPARELHGTAKTSRGGGGAGAISLNFSEAMFAGAVSRSIAQTCMQPMNVIKTLLQGRETSSQLSQLSFKLLTRGAGAQFLMSLPHGAFNFATLEVILGCSFKMVPSGWREAAGPAFDFLSSSAATLVCSVVSTPQMVITDRIMTGMYPDLAHAVREISGTDGMRGFYTGWGANVAQKIPSYGLTWVFFQEFKRLHRKATERPPTNTENFVLGAAAAGATVCIMIPLDTVKTRLVTQTVQPGVVPYRGILPTLVRIAREEGVAPLYRSLGARLASVVPMIGIQFGIYEFVRKELMSRKSVDIKLPA